MTICKIKLLDRFDENFRLPQVSEQVFLVFDLTGMAGCERNAQWAKCGTRYIRKL